MKFTVLFLLLTFSPLSFAARQNTADYWKCENKSSGSWIFGEAPKACSASSFIAPQFTRDKYDAYIFDEAKNSNVERIRYVSEMNNLIENTADYYLKKRKPSASTAEKSAWIKAIKAISHQESFISHYRLGTDKELRLMRGDLGHGHGIMQIDDRWHFAAVGKGRAANLVDNLFYAMDIYFKAWEQAPKASCLNNPSDYYKRTRAAYSAYNGGLGSICRFTNPKHKWARNDSNFKDKLDAQSWKRYISNAVKITPVNVNCLSNPNQICSTPSNPELKKVLKYNNLLCALDQSSYKCIEDFSLRFCLVDKYQLINQVVSTNVKRPVTLLTPDQACSKDEPVEPEILSVGDFVKPEKNIFLRESPGGRRLGVVRTDETFQVLDVKRIGLKNYYQILKNGQRGYFYTGTDEVLSDWSVQAESADYRPLPVKGSLVKIVTPFGTNLRKTAGGEKLAVASSGSTLEVLSTVFIKDTGKFYIQVNTKGETGFLYTGKTNPYLTTSDWVEVLK